MIERLVLVAGVLIVAFVAVAWLERRRIRPMSSALRPGLNIVTGPDCRLCDQLIAQLGRLGRVPERVFDAEQATLLGVRSLPTVLAVGTDGAVLARRSGRSAISDLDAVLARLGSGR